MIRAKFRVIEIKQSMMSCPTGEKDPDTGCDVWGEKPCDTVVLSPVYSDKDDDENRRFWTATPQGSIDMAMSNPEAAGLFKLGKAYYVDFSEAPDAAE